MSEKKKFWCLQVVFADELNNGFVILGGTGYLTEHEWEAAWNEIQEAPGGVDNRDNLCVDKLDQEGDQLAERFITAATAERLLKKPIDQLIEEGRAKTTFTWGELKKKMALG